MEAYNDIKNKLLAINQDISHIIQDALSIDGLASQSIKAWQSATARIERQLAEETIRVAVVGSIKSGKSTLTNALFGGDYLKRGAGVVTSIITRIQPGHGLRARLEFKTWDEINADINQALILFSSTSPEDGGGDFDINDEKDRLRLQHDLSRLNTDQLVSDDTLDPNCVLLTEYLSGYNRVKGIVSSEPVTHMFESDDFHKQKDFVGDESLAVYLRDVCLTLEAPRGFGENLEVADCQGSDSTNPLHLVTIQDYLIQTHLIIYVVSSRTGVRRADIRFLNLIKKMGLTKNILFVINCDFSEHETLADLKGLVGRVEKEVGMIFPAPCVFTFSALYNLFKSIDYKGGVEQAIARKDRRRLEQWREENDMVAFSDQQTETFLKAVIQKVSMDRFALLLVSNLERISSISSGLRDWIRINQDLLKKDAGEVQEAFSKMGKRQEASDQITMVIKDTLDGTTLKLRRNLGNDVERFFDSKSGEIVQDLTRFIRSYNLSIKDYEKDLDASGFLPTLYRIFQTMQQTANLFIAESINPKLVNFVRQEEKKAGDVFEQVAGPYSLMIKDAVKQYQRTMKKLGIKIQDRPFKAVRSPDVDSVKSDARLNIPRLAGTIQYSTRIKTEAILRLSIYKTVKTVKKLLKKPVKEGPDSAMRSLEASVRGIKKQMQESIKDHFLDYKESLKYQYVFKLVDAMSIELYEALTDRMRAFTGNLSDMKGLIENKGLAKDRLAEELASMQTSLNVALKETRTLEKLVAIHE